MMITERELDIWKLEADFEYSSLIEEIVAEYYGSRLNGISQGNIQQEDAVFEDVVYQEENGVLTTPDAQTGIY